MAGTGAKESCCFTPEIQQMMYGCGDAKRPLTETAEAVELVVRQQMAVLLCKCCESAEARGARNLGLEDVLFVLRHNKAKVQRFLRYMTLKDMSKTSANKSAGEGVRGKRRREICEDFLLSIDTTGELAELLASDTQHMDLAYLHRLQRAEIRSRNMETQEYLEFCRARQMSFIHKFRTSRFSEWLFTMCAGLKYKPAQAATEIYAYFAYETLCQIVDLALMVKHDGEQDPGLPRRTVHVLNNYPNIQPQLPGVDSPFSPESSGDGGEGLKRVGVVVKGGLDSSGASTDPASTQPLNIHSSRRSKKRKRLASAGQRLAHMTYDVSCEALTPTHVTEAVRRYFAPTGVATVRRKPAEPVFTRTLLAA